MDKESRNMGYEIDKESRNMGYEIGVLYKQWKGLWCVRPANYHWPLNTDVRIYTCLSGI